MDSNPTIAWLTSHCRSTPLDEKWLLVEHLRVGQQWKDRLTRSGCWHINLHAKTMRLIVNELSAQWVATSSALPISSSALELLFTGVVEELAEQNRLLYFSTSAASRSALSRLLLRTYNDWRLAGLTIEHLAGDALEVPAKAADLQLIFRIVQERLSASKQFDYAARISAVIASIDCEKLSIPTDLVILQPESFLLTNLERNLLDLLRSRNVTWHVPEGTQAASSVQLDSVQASTVRPSRQVAVGEFNEVRGVFQRCLASSTSPTRLDEVEILATDYELYAPIVLECLWQTLSLDGNSGVDSEKLTIESVPITFAEGIACIYSRPGRLLRSYVRWLESDCLQAKAVQIVREGLLTRPASAEKIGYARLASVLRSVPIGFGLDRYLPQLNLQWDAARRDMAAQLKRDPEFQGDCGSATLRALLELFEPLVALVPQTGQSPIAILEAARMLLDRHARAENVIDRYARAKLIEEIDGMISAIRTHYDARTNVRSWLEELPARSRLLSSTPQPGRVHVAPLEQGGASGRANVFILGLDDRKFPRRQPNDPILLDAERKRISPLLITAEQIANHQQAALDRVIARSEGIECAQITFSYSLCDLNDDSEAFPSPALNRLGIPGSDTETVAFVADRAECMLTIAEASQRQLLLEPDAITRWQTVEQRFPRIVRQRQAAAHQSSPNFGEFDGWVPEAGRDLLASATTRPMSPSRLELLGTCPRKYFFARALAIFPPDEWSIDTDRWLSPIEIGNLLHELFEDFLRELQTADEMPEPSRHAMRLQEMLQTKITEAAQLTPVRNPEAFERQRDELVEFCEIFLQKENEYARQRDAKTWIMEASLGSLTHQNQHAQTEIDTDQPIALELTRDRKLHLCGRIDRIDRLGSGTSARYLIWDYKTGSNWGFDQGDALQQGRKLQPLLYARMLAARLAQLGHNPQAVQGFGYFFPSPRCEGLRYEWSMKELLEGNAVLESMLDLLETGTFIATNNEADCGYCDYEHVCGRADQLVSISQLKSDSDNPQLTAWRTLRS